ncbi:hypothetical protein [Metapseudomonas otitidis]|uniref:hypothetical protein n=1 Tax=Metapseudomonas otitidis TaxID=319939 RepID=UPI00160368BB|nr:hypothetical protein [Pseudomonas otitidis]
MLLVAAGFDRYRVESLVYEINDIGVRKVLGEFERVYKTSDGGGHYYERNYSKKNVSEEYQGSDVVVRVVDLLVNESNLSVGQSFFVLERELELTFPGREIAVPRPKSGLASWVKALTKEFTESELLHVASKIRNQVAHGHGAGDDWVLKE